MASDFFWDPSGLGQIVIEAEHHASADAQWAEESSIAGFSGEGYMRATGGGQPFCGDHTCVGNAPAMEFAVDFPEAGSWEVWLRGWADDGGSDSVHSGIDGTATASSAKIGSFATQAWTWHQQTMSANPAVIQVGSAGERTFQIFRREYDFRLDKIVLVKTGATPALPEPSGTGPSETPDVVPSTFSSPVQLTSLGGDDYDVTVWGRTYEFRGGPVPTSIYTQGTRLLKNGGGGIPALRRPSGDWQNVTWSSLSVLQERDQRVVLEAVGTAGADLEVTCRTTIEYDGMLRFDLTLKAVSSTVELKDVMYNHVLDASAIEFFSHHVPYDFNDQNVDKDKLLESAGVFPADETISYTPALFAGDREIGIEWWFESNAYWDTQSEPIRLTKDGSYAAVQAFPVRDAALFVDSTEGWSDTWAMFPMPMRPDPDRRKRRFGNQSLFGSANLDLDLSLYDLYQMTVTSAGFAPQDMGFPKAERDGSGALLPNHAEILDAMDDRGVAYVPYGFLTLAPYHSVADTNRSLWRANQDDTDPMDLGPPDTYFACAGRADYLAWHREKTVDDVRTAPADEPIAGLYFDHGSISRMCEYSPVLQEPGVPAQREIWEHFRIRDYYKRLYETIHREGLDVIVTSHHHGSPKALNAFIDVVFMGESLNSAFCTGDGGSGVRCASYDPDYWGELPAGFLDGLLYPVVGGTTALLPQVRHCSKPKWVDQNQIPEPDCPERQRELHALTLLNDYPVWWAQSYAQPNEDYGAELSQSTGGIYQAADLMGSLADATFFGWWEIGSKAVVSATGGDVRASVYTNPNDQKAIVVLVNAGGSTATQVSATLDLGILGLASSSQYRNPEEPEASATDINNGVVDATADIAPRDFEMILVEPQP